MSNHYKIRIAVKPYVKKYIQKMYGPELLINKRNPTSMLLYFMLQKKKTYLFNLPEDKFNISRQTEEITILIRKSSAYKTGIFYTAKNQFIINNYFEQRIIETIHASSLCSSKQKAVQLFMEKFEIVADGDVSEETLLRRLFYFEKDIAMVDIAKHLRKR